MTLERFNQMRQMAEKSKYLDSDHAYQIKKTITKQQQNSNLKDQSPRKSLFETFNRQDFEGADLIQIVSNKQEKQYNNLPNSD